MKALSVHGFAGAFDLGVVQAGFELVGRRQAKGDFGGALVEGNRHLLPGPWETVADDPETWPVVEVDFVFGNPPCSGFSALSVFTRSADGEWKDGRGVDSHLNKGMYELVDLASKIKPEAIAFESVEAAGRKGRSLMLKLRDRLEDQSGIKYNLTHVYQDNASVGGVSIRRRYHWVAHRFPTLGMDDMGVTRVPTLRETIGDLADTPLDWEGSPDGHQILDIVTAQDVKRIAEMATSVGDPWRSREKVGRVTCRLGVPEDASCFDCKDAKAANKPAPHPFAGLDMSWVRNIHRKSNLYAVVRWNPDDAARVITGGFLEDAVHPWLDRTFTFREAARIQGFPDDWTMLPARDVRHSSAWLGKGIPVTAGRWIAAGVKRSLEGDPGPLQGYWLGEREKIIDAIGSWRETQPQGVHRDQIPMFG